MGYLNELLARNPLVIDGDTIKPHHKYTDDLYTGGKTKMTNYDRIKSMSVEEMAKIICESENCEKICVFSKDGICNAFGTDASICVEGCKQWLLQEVNGDE